jgi:hypothetical protein
MKSQLTCQFIIMFIKCAASGDDTECHTNVLINCNESGTRSMGDGAWTVNLRMSTQAFFSLIEAMAN